MKAILLGQETDISGKADKSEVDSKNQTQDAAIQKAQETADGAVKRSDKATAEDLAANADDKWVTPKMLKENSSSHSPGDIVWSENNLAEMYPDQYLAYNGQTLDLSQYFTEIPSALALRSGVIANYSSLSYPIYDCLDYGVILARHTGYGNTYLYYGNKATNYSLVSLNAIISGSTTSSDPNIYEITQKIAYAQGKKLLIMYRQTNEYGKTYLVTIDISTSTPRLIKRMEYTETPMIVNEQNGFGGNSICGAISVNSDNIQISLSNDDTTFNFERISTSHPDFYGSQTNVNPHLFFDDLIVGIGSGNGSSQVIFVYQISKKNIIYSEVNTYGEQYFNHRTETIQTNRLYCEWDNFAVAYPGDQSHGVALGIVKTGSNYTFKLFKNSNILNPIFPLIKISDKACSAIGVTSPVNIRKGDISYSGGVWSEVSEASIARIVPVTDTDNIVIQNLLIGNSKSNSDLTFREYVSVTINGYYPNGDDGIATGIILRGIKTTDMKTITLLICKFSIQNDKISKITNVIPAYTITDSTTPTDSLYESYSGFSNNDLLIMSKNGIKRILKIDYNRCKLDSTTSKYLTIEKSPN